MDDDARHRAVIVGNHGQWGSMSIFRRDILAYENDSAFKKFVRQNWNVLREVYWKGGRFHVRLGAPCYLNLTGRSLHAHKRNRFAGKPERHARFGLAWSKPADCSVE